MTTSFKPFGFSDVGYLLGAKPRGASYTFNIASGNAGNFGSGEPVSIVNGNLFSVIPATSYDPSNAQATILGIFQSVYYRPSQPDTPPATFDTWLSGTTTYNSELAKANINVDPFVIYNIQANATLDYTYVGGNFNIGGVNNLDANGNSQVYLNTSSSPYTYPYLQVRLIGLAPTTPVMKTQGGNNWGDPYPIVQVVINNSSFRYGTNGA
jgi:hypothetical protein